MTGRLRSLGAEELTRHRRTALAALRSEFSGWAFALTDDPATGTTRWVAAPGHDLMPLLRVLRATDRVEAENPTALRALLAAHPAPPRARARARR